ncbi:MAG TPA: prepilin peptidase [Candidatus Baltobacteraceae bacterium]|jgi:prepilin peptidase CpaA|nr:prepilin peptidase [Candidatus Baltobacteraceae bacterium]
MTVLYFVALVACALAVFTDVRYRRIPNVLTFTLAAVVLVVQCVNGWGNLAVSIACLTVVFFLGTVAYVMRWLGGGDVKFAAALSASFGYPDTVAFLLYTSIAGGILALIVSLAHGRLGATTANVMRIMQPNTFPQEALAAPLQPMTLPYAIAISCGTLVVILSHTMLPFLRLHL